VTTMKSCSKQHMTYLWLFHEGFHEFSMGFPYVFHGFPCGVVTAWSLYLLISLGDFTLSSNKSAVAPLSAVAHSVVEMFHPKVFHCFIKNCFIVSSNNVSLCHCFIEKCFIVSSNNVLLFHQKLLSI